MHFQHKFKHMGCGLHFIVTSFLSDWPDWKDRPKMWCPECGGTEGFIHWMEPSDKEIFEVVPGSAPLTSIGVS